MLVSFIEVFDFWLIFFLKKNVVRLLSGLYFIYIFFFLGICVKIYFLFCDLFL